MLLRSIRRNAKKVAAAGSLAVAAVLGSSSAAFAILGAEETAAIGTVTTKVTDMSAGVLPLIGTALAVGVGITLFIKYVKKVPAAA